MNITRHIGIFQIRTGVTLIGLGGIGSPTAIALAKMGTPYLSVVDPDVISEENLATQLHPMANIGYSKASSMAEMLRRFSDVQFTAVPGYAENISTGTLQNPIIVSAVDSITARKTIWNTVKLVSPQWYLDARMAAESFQLFSVNMDDYGWYESALNSLNEEDIPDLPCTSKAPIYTGFMAAGHIAATVKAINVGEEPPHVLVHDIKNIAMMTI